MVITFLSANHYYFIVYFYILLGILIGLFAGFVPGLHSNTIVSFMYSLGIPPEILSLLIIAVFAAYSITSFIPSLFLGIPDESSILSVLPGQRMVKEGKGLLALKIVLFSGILSAIISVAFFPFSLDFFQILYSAIKPYLSWILILFSLLLILKTKNILYALLIFLLSGFLGYSTFKLNLNDPFLPMFTGMFAMAAIITYTKSKIPKQKDEKLEPNFIPYVFLGVIGGIISDLLPGVSSTSQVASFLSIFFPITSIGYLATIVSVSVSQSILALSTAASIGKSRIGAIVWLDKVSPVKENLFLYLVLFLLALSVTVLLIYLLRNKLIRIVELDFSIVNKILVVYLLALVFFISGTYGLIVFGIATLLGYLTLKLNVERTMLMGSIIIPTIMLLLKIFI